MWARWIGTDFRRREDVSAAKIISDVGGFEGAKMSNTRYFAKAEKICGPYSLTELQSKLRERDQKGIHVWCSGFRAAHPR